VSFGDGAPSATSPTSNLCHKSCVDIAIISVPAHAAQSIIDRSSA